MIWLVFSRREASLLSMVAAKWRLFVHGTERPIPKPRPVLPDTILEEIHAKHPEIVPYERRDWFKGHYQQWKSHQKLIEHNKKIRKLDKKIKRGLYDNWDYANKW